MSQHDLQAGSRWAAELAGELDGTQVGIIVITKDNLDEPWVNYEAGALSKTVNGDSARVIPLLMGIQKSEVGYPLAQFHMVDGDKDGVFELLKALNAGMPSPQEEAWLTDVFDTWWPKLEPELAQTPTEAAKAQQVVAQPQRGPQDMLTEVLDLLREMRREQTSASRHRREFERLLAVQEEVRPTPAEALTHLRSVLTDAGWQNTSVYRAKGQNQITILLSSGDNHIGEDLWLRLQKIARQYGFHLVVEEEPPF